MSTYNSSSWGRGWGSSSVPCISQMGCTQGEGSVKGQGFGVFVHLRAACLTAEQRAPLMRRAPARPNCLNAQ